MRISAYESVIDYAYQIMLYEWYWLWYRYDFRYVDTVMILIRTVSMNEYVMTACMSGFHHWVASHITRQNFSDSSE